MKWFKKEKINYPDFWNDYQNCFNNKEIQEISQVRFVILDTETTGLNPKNDRILSIGAVEVIDNAINVSESLEMYVYQDKFNPESVKIHGILQNENKKSISEALALKKFLKYIGNSVIVGHHIGFDIAMINQALIRLGLPRLNNKVLDTMMLYRASRINSNLIDRGRSYTLDEIAESLDIELQDRHTATGDAYITAIAFVKILSRLNKRNELKLKDLFRLI